jgi:hypothetical protein
MAAREWPRPSPRQLEDLRRPPASSRCFSFISAAQCHGADTGLTSQCCIVAGMASPRGSVEQHRGVIPSRVRVMACVLWRQSIKCSHA